MIPCDDVGGSGEDVCMKLQQYLLALSTWNNDDGIFWSVRRTDFRSVKFLQK
jgi:hypothetical protein